MAIITLENLLKLKSETSNGFNTHMQFVKTPSIDNWAYFSPTHRAIPKSCKLGTSKSWCENLFYSALRNVIRSVECYFGAGNESLGWLLLGRESSELGLDDKCDEDDYIRNPSPIRDAVIGGLAIAGTLSWFAKVPREAERDHSDYERSKVKNQVLVKMLNRFNSKNPDSWWKLNPEQMNLDDRVWEIDDIHLMEYDTLRENWLGIRKTHANTWREKSKRRWWKRTGY